MKRLTPQLSDTGGIHVVRWIEEKDSYLPCGGDRFHKAQHKRHRETPSWLIGTVAGLSSVAVLVVSWTAGLL